MKKLLLILCLLLAFNSYTQTTTKKYNSLQKRYEYYQNGKMIGYEKYNSLQKQWEYYSTKTSQSTSSYGEPVSNFDADLAMKVLQYKQNRYDRLSDSEKAKIWASKEYNRKRRYVNKMTYPILKKTLRKHKKKERKLKRNYKKIKNEKRIDINTLENGWYNCYSKIDNNYHKRKVFIENGNIIQYLNGRNILFQITNFRKGYNNSYIMNGNVLSIDIELTVFIIKDKKIKKPIIEKPSQLIIYTKSNNINGDILIVLKGNNEYYSQKPIEYYLVETPSCSSQQDGVSNILVPSGKYKYYASSITEFWTDDIYLEEYDCKKINLNKK